jgi:hypothetical protein
MPLTHPHHVRLLRVLARSSRQYLTSIYSKPSGVRGAAGHSTSRKPKELLSRDKTDAQQTLLEEAAENAAQLLTAAQEQRRRSSAEAWTVRWDWASY